MLLRELQVQASEFWRRHRHLLETVDLETTTVIFLGDNGTGVQVRTQFKGQEYPGGKGTRTARGNHVPLIANWRGKVPAGKVNTDLVGAVDFLPTLCEAGGATADGSAPPGAA